MDRSSHLVSESGVGRAGGESVVLFADGEIVTEIDRGVLPQDRRTEMTNTQQAVEIMAGLIDRHMTDEAYAVLMGAIRYLNGFLAWRKDETGEDQSEDEYDPKH